MAGIVRTLPKFTLHCVDRDFKLKSVRVVKHGEVVHLAANPVIITLRVIEGRIWGEFLGSLWLVTQLPKFIKQLLGLNP